MKKVIFILVFLLTAAGLFAADQPKITFVSGAVDVELQNAEGETLDMVPAEVKMRLPSQSVVRTGYDGHCEILMPDRSTVILSCRTNFKIDSYENNQSSFDLIAGKVRAIVKRLKKDGKFTVASGTSLAGVRGTDFGIEYNVRETSVIVFEGEVYLENETGYYEVPAGKMAVVDKNNNTSISDTPPVVQEEWKEMESKKNKTGLAAGIFGVLAIIAIIAL